MTRLLTIRQPFASAMFRTVGPKTIENRSRHTSVRGRIGIHAGLQLHERADDPVYRAVEAGTMPLGVILGTVQLVGCHRAGTAGCRNAECYQNVWADFPGPIGDVWHWELDHPREFVTPIKAKGALGFWAPLPTTEYLMEIADVVAVLPS